MTHKNPEHSNDHVGRTWTGHSLEDECPCPQEPCGLVALDKVVEECTQHPFGRFKTIRQYHKATACPSLKEVWETEDAVLIIMGTHDIDEALTMAKKYYADEVSEEYEMERKDFELLAKKLWVNKNNPLYESERWSDEMISEEEKTGWSPYISVCH